MGNDPVNEMVRHLLDLFNKTTKGPWHLRTFPDGKDFFIEAPEPEERGFGYDIEIMGEDDNGYPTRKADAEFIIACHEVLPELLKKIAERIHGRRMAVAEHLLTSAEVMEVLSEKTDVELAELIKEHLWADVDVFSPEDCLLTEVVERLEEK